MLEARVFLGVLDEPDIEWLVANSRRHEVSAESVLIRHGAPVEHMYLIVDGAFDVTIFTPAARRIATLYAGELVGEMSFVDLHPPSATVSAAMNSIVLEISKALLLEKIQRDSGFGTRFYKGISVLLAGRLRAAYTIDHGARSAADSEKEMGILEQRYKEIHARLGVRRLASGM